MNKYIAFLRAVNVGGNNIIKMTELKKSFEDLKYTDVTTFIQSGNVIFGSSEKKTGVLIVQIEKQLLKFFGLNVAVMIRTEKELKNIIDKNPFGNENLSKDLMLYIAFLTNPPARSAAEELSAFDNENEKFRVVGNNVYCLINKKIKTMFSNNWLEKKLGTASTTRNITTLIKLYRLASK